MLLSSMQCFHLPYATLEGSEQDANMLQRCLQRSIRFLAAAEAICGQASALQLRKPLHTRTAIDSLSYGYPSTQQTHLAQHDVRNAESWASSGASAAVQYRAGGFQGIQQATPRCLYSASWSCLERSDRCELAHQSQAYRRTGHETHANEQTRTFAKASRLAQPASRAARKVAQRLPQSRPPATDTEGSSSSEQSDLTQQESSSVDDTVVTQAEHSKASDVQVTHCPRLAQ